MMHKEVMDSTSQLKTSSIAYEERGIMRVRFAVLRTGLLMLLLTLLLGQPALAGTWSPSEGWTSAEGSYSPDNGNTSMYEYTDSAGKLKLSPKVRFSFYDGVVVAIQNMNGLYGGGYWYTMDIATSDANTSLSAYGSYYSTLPSPHFDLDDDNGYGKNDESEVTCLDPYSLRGNTDYRFEAYFNVYSKTQAPMNFTSQKSYKAGTEYNAMNFETHKVRWYPW